MLLVMQTMGQVGTHGQLGSELICSCLDEVCA